MDSPNVRREQTKCVDILRVPRARGGILLVMGASDVGGGGTLYHWRALGGEEYRSGINKLGT